MGQWEPSVGASNEWYTPSYVFDALGCRFDLDVAHPHGVRTHVPCDGYLSRDGLSTPWFGFIWMNPPFGGRNGLTPWLDQFFAHGNGVALVPDRTSAPWFRDAWRQADLVMFTPKIRFLRPDGSQGKCPSNGTALMAVGKRGCVALENAYRAGLGILARPEGLAA
ncbi:DNA N-6-adenine-methyltransferase [Sphingobium yanoikuyae]|uniref:Adenine methyltransferase n=1 Tax=Sphingobium yanoikuyae TaxID=13690 RepID=A0A0J9CUT3_SPHYA|nr:DNA N-6-adenine-methyltransferase [Sphingobium yanoikuyae]ATP19813.1 hypothetical protein BV87_16360 [Sphingobium yanoikuyae]KMW28883.1 hypothetical protein BV87_18320 [Sphingobium yanoikuyae]